MEKQQLQEAIDQASKILAQLEKQIAGYTVLTVPVSLVVERDAKIKELEKYRSMLSGKNPLCLDNLPRRESFFGRTGEISKALIALEPQTRTWGVVLDGIGGIGKTALAVEVAYLAKEKGLFDNFIFLSAKQSRLTGRGEKITAHHIDTLDDFLDGLSDLMGVSFGSSLSLEKKLSSTLTILRDSSGPNKKTLLIFDNLETFSKEELSLVSEWLVLLPQDCKAIVTSRKWFGDAAIWIRLDKLDWNAAKQLILEEMLHSEIVKQVFELEDEKKWMQLYDASGGSPLALHWILDIIRLRNLSLDRALPWLSKAETDSDLMRFIYQEALKELGEEDIIILGSLALMDNASVVEPLIYITGLPKLSIESSIERLSALSLMNIHGPEGPYSLHPLTRQLSMSELSRKPDFANSQKKKFSEYWLKAVRQYRANEKSTGGYFSKLENEWGNITSSFYFLNEFPENDSANMLIELLSYIVAFAWNAGLTSQIKEMCDLGYKKALSLNDFWNAGWFAKHVAWVFYSQKDLSNAKKWIDLMENAFETIDDNRCDANTIRLRALIERDLANYSEAKQLFGTVEALLRKFNSREDRAILLNDLGGWFEANNDFQNAERNFVDALKICAEIDNKAFQATLLCNLAQIAIKQSQLSKAKDYYEKSLLIAQQVEEKKQKAIAQAGLAYCYWQEGKFKNALVNLNKAIPVFEKTIDRDLDSLTFIKNDITSNNLNKV